MRVVLMKRCGEKNQQSQHQDLKVWCPLNYFDCFVPNHQTLRTVLFLLHSCTRHRSTFILCRSDASLDLEKAWEAPQVFSCGSNKKDSSNDPRFGSPCSFQRLCALSISQVVQEPQEPPPETYLCHRFASLPRLVERDQLAFQSGQVWFGGISLGLGILAKVLQEASKAQNLMFTRNVAWNMLNSLGFNKTLWI